MSSTIKYNSYHRYPSYLIRLVQSRDQILERESWLALSVCPALARECTVPILLKFLCCVPLGSSCNMFNIKAIGTPVHFFFFGGGGVVVHPVR